MTYLQLLRNVRHSWYRVWGVWLLCWWTSHRATDTHTELDWSHCLWLILAKHMDPRQTIWMDGKLTLMSFSLSCMLSVHLYKQMFRACAAHEVRNRTPQWPAQVMLHHMPTWVCRTWCFMIMAQYFMLLENDFVADLIGANTAQCNSFILCWFSFNTRHNLHGQTMTQTPQPRSHSTVIVKTIFSHKKNKRSCNRWRGSHRALISTSRTQSGKTRGDKTRNTACSSTLNPNLNDQSF